MKKILAMVLAMMLLVGASAEQEIGAMQPEMGAAYAIDLDGDGVQETLTWNSIAINEYDEIAEVRVQNVDGAEVGWGSDILYGARVYLHDTNSDGAVEIFISGDQMSDDYITYCLQYTGDGLEQLRFADVNRGENTGDYYDYGYGMVTAFDGIEVSLTGSQDMLGTWFATRRLALIDGQFEIVDDGYWICDPDVTDPEVWEYRSLTPVQPIPVTFVVDYNTVPGELQPGERVLLTYFDKLADAFFVTEDGRVGYFTAFVDQETGWGWTINGVSEYDLFETVPYAD